MAGKAVALNAFSLGISLCRGGGGGLASSCAHPSLILLHGAPPLCFLLLLLRRKLPGAVVTSTLTKAKVT